MNKKYLARVFLGLVLMSGLMGVAAISRADTSPAVSIVEISQQVSVLSQAVSTLSSIDAQHKAMVAQVKDRLGVIVANLAPLVSMPTATEADRAALSVALAPLITDVNQLIPVVHALVQIKAQEQGIILTISNRLTLISNQLTQLQQH